MSNLNRSDYDYDNDNDKRLHGILAAVDMSAEMRERVLRAGFYVARIHDQIFALDVPDDFQPKTY
ncbi:MAG: hypothetical protein JZU52_14940 [Lamprocystis purpurea]|uniref:hypothetical protein n=1 Tax=Lamprocystis purpurea TaxID=61598 RepID=UPI00035FD65C|nr:hypothetical protein [Lamprocystis purpurea]MBV5274873.1 hypothetical protein [Lamprocystis purpurea]